MLQHKPQRGSDSKHCSDHGESRHRLPSRLLPKTGIQALDFDKPSFSWHGTTVALVKMLVRFLGNYAARLQRAKVCACGSNARRSSTPTKGHLSTSHSSRTGFARAVRKVVLRWLVYRHCTVVQITGRRKNCVLNTESVLRPHLIHVRLK